MFVIYRYRVPLRGIAVFHASLKAKADDESLDDRD